MVKDRRITVVVKRDIEIARGKFTDEQRGAAVKKFREQLGLSVRQLAALADTSRQSISNLEAAKGGRLRVSISTEARVLDALTTEMAKRKAQAVPSDASGVYGSVTLATLAKPAPESTQEVPALVSELLQLSLELGRQEDGMSPESALSFAGRFQSLGTKLLDGGFLSLAKDAIKQSQYLTDWAKARFELLEKGGK
jgi:transcriptional regulator with XRE-family HTH domain